MADSAPYPDEVTLGDAASPVGLCTLWTRQERILRGVPRELYAACGNLYSLWGISLLVRGVLARPTLRYLVLCGIDYAGTGRALVTLAREGVALDGTIPGTDVRLADDVNVAAVARFRQQVAIVDLRGCTDGGRVAVAIRALAPPPIWDQPAPILVPAGWTPTEAVPLAARDSGGETAPPSPPNTGGGQDAVLAARAGSVERAVGESDLARQPAQQASRPSQIGGSGGRGGFEADPAGNFLIAVGEGRIVAAHATTVGGPTGQRFVGRTAADVYSAILAAALVSRLDHAAYLGAELARAEVALRLGLPYRQDRPLTLRR